MDHQEYFDNLDKIERLWRDLKNDGFPQTKRDDLWRLCMQGQQLFWQFATENNNLGYPMVCTVPAFERAIMLLEHEGKYKNAIAMCKEANKWKINTDWYDKRIVKLTRRIKKPPKREPWRLFV